MVLDEAYKKGFLDGLTAYAVNKDGVQYVGSCGTTLKGAKQRVEKTWNYSPPYSGMVGASNR